MGAWRTLPAEFRADRIFLRPVTQAGSEILLLSDTGGGVSFFSTETAAALDGAAERVEVGGRSVEVVPMPGLRAETWIPPVPLLPVLSIDEASGGHAELLEDAGGFLGQNWFADRVWLLDYPAGRMAVWQGDGAPDATAGARSVPLFFRKDPTGARHASFPRIAAEVDGEEIDFLLDTGATMVATAGARAVLGTPGVRGASFIVQSIFDRWHLRHPEWRVVEDADAAFGDDAIEVPEVVIGGARVGPVWFTARNGENFARMSQWMDRRVDGALGGSALRHLRLVVDYAQAVCRVGLAADDRPGSSS